MRFPDYTNQSDKVPVSEEIDFLWEEHRRVYRHLADQNKQIIQLKQELDKLKVNA